jgi:hypothetical protein
MTIAAQNYTAGYTGCKVVANTAPTAGNWRGFSVNTACIVSALTGVDQNGNAVNFLTQIGLASVTLSLGSVITVVDGSAITSITLASGSVILRNI